MLRSPTGSPGQPPGGEVAVIAPDRARLRKGNQHAGSISLRHCNNSTSSQRPCAPGHRFSQPLCDKNVAPDTPFTANTTKTTANYPETTPPVCNNCRFSSGILTLALAMRQHFVALARIQTTQAGLQEHVSCPQPPIFINRHGLTPLRRRQRTAHPVCKTPRFASIPGRPFCRGRS